MQSLFSLPPRSTKAGDSLIIGKTAKKPTSKPSAGQRSGNDIATRMANALSYVNRVLGKYADDYDIIRTESDLKSLIDAAIQNGVIAIDTETDSLEPITTTLAGVSLYTPGRNAAYIPLHHINYITKVLLADQLPASIMSEQLQRLVENRTKIEMFNAKFDIRVIKNQLGVKLTAYHDGYIAARMLNELEDENGLKYLYRKYCNNGEGDAFSFNDLFKGIPFTEVPPGTGYLYAAHDAPVTHDLCQFQAPFLDASTEACQSRNLLGVSQVFHNIEMKLVPIIVEMEDTGISFDVEYCKKLQVKYQAKLEEAVKEFLDECAKHQTEIDKYLSEHVGTSKLKTPINPASFVQIAILLYDILQIKPPDKENPRGTGDDILAEIDHPVAKAIQKYRGIAILISTFIDKMLAVVNPKTGRIHCSFNQIGADTGRFSSSDPNMQNIPSHNTEIRQMFVATKDYVLLSADYSAQEPRLTAHMSGDEKMIEAYRQGKDLYVEIASLAFGVPADECKEFRADGTKNPEGKERRSRAKAIVLGINYSKGISSIAEDLHITRKDAQAIYNKVLETFPGLSKFMRESQDMARELGYVTTVWGRKRRLPDMQLAPYVFSLNASANPEFDPLDDSEDNQEVPDAVIRKYTQQLNHCRSREDRNRIIRAAAAIGVVIKDNTGYIAEATRQCVNSRIQGSAADQIKLAMILIGNDEQLKQLGFRLLLQVHDELIGECPEKNAKEASERFSKLMVEAAKELSVPSICDVEVSKSWYGKVIDV